MLSGLSCGKSSSPARAVFIRDVVHNTAENMEKPRYYTDNIGPIAENEMTALKKAIELSQEIENIGQITILIHTKRNTGYIERTIGSKYLKSLFNGTVTAYNNGPKLKIETLRTFDKVYGWQKKRSILLAFGLDSKDLFKYDDDETIKGMVAHQWMENGVADWAKTWGAIELISGEKIETTDFPDKIVQKAFDELTGVINLSTGIHHSMDNNRCKTYLKALNKYDYELDPVKIKSYLITKLNWENRHTDDVIELIEKLNAGRYFKGGDKTGLQNHIKRWKSKD